MDNSIQNRIRKQSLIVELLKIRWNGVIKQHGRKYILNKPVEIKISRPPQSFIS